MPFLLPGQKSAENVLSEVLNVLALRHLHSLSNVGKDVEGSLWAVRVEARDLVQKRDDLQK